MDCQAIDIKAYALNEASPAGRREAELHLKNCAECREELARLQFVQAALGGLREEDPPRRIAFVSDKVFEPNWWQRFWASGPRVGFAAAALLSAAILIHAAAVTQSEARQDAKVQALLEATEKKYEGQSEALKAVLDQLDIQNKRDRMAMIQNAGLVKY